MNLIERINELASAIGSEIKKLKTRITTLEGSVASSSSINDTTPSSTTTYSSNKVNDLIRKTQTDIIGGAAEAYNTLKEIEDYITTDKSGAAAMATVVGQKLKVNEVHTLTSQELTNVQTSLKLGNTDVDLVAVFNNALK